MIPSRKVLRPDLRETLRAALPAALLSGLPSTIHALIVKGDPFEATAAAGSILLPREARRSRLVVAAIPVHLGLSITWAAAMTAVLPRRNPTLEGTVAGLVIAAIDLGIIGPQFPRIRALRPLPQIADHIAFGVLVATTLGRSCASSAAPRAAGPTS